MLRKLIEVMHEKWRSDSTTLTINTYRGHRPRIRKSKGWLPEVARIHVYLRARTPLFPICSQAVYNTCDLTLKFSHLCSHINPQAHVMHVCAQTLSVGKQIKFVWGQTLANTSAPMNRCPLTSCHACEHMCLNFIHTCTFTSMNLLFSVPPTLHRSQTSEGGPHWVPQWAWQVSSSVLSLPAYPSVWLCLLALQGAAQNRILQETFPYASA